MNVCTHTETQRAQLEGEEGVLAIIKRRNGENGQHFSSRVTLAINRFLPNRIKLMGKTDLGQIKHETITLNG